jgi:hypothetical protein
MAYNYMIEHFKFEKIEREIEDFDFIHLTNHDGREIRIVWPCDYMGVYPMASMELVVSYENFKLLDESTKDDYNFFIKNENLFNCSITNLDNWCTKWATVLYMNITYNRKKPD